MAVALYIFPTYPFPTWCGDWRQNHLDTTSMNKCQMNIVFKVKPGRVLSKEELEFRSAISPYAHTYTHAFQPSARLLPTPTRTSNSHSAVIKFLPALFFKPHTTQSPESLPFATINILHNVKLNQQDKKDNPTSENNQKCKSLFVAQYHGISVSNILSPYSMQCQPQRAVAQLVGILCTQFSLKTK